MEFVLELLNEQKKLLSIELGECEGEEHQETKKRLEQVEYAIKLLSQSKMERKPIEYTVENKNGVHEYSNSFEINDRVKILRVRIEHPVSERNPITYIVKKISNKDKSLKFDDSSTASSGQCSTVNHFDIDEHIDNTNDLKFELINNSKIRVQLFFKERELIQYDFPTINLFEQDGK